MPSVCMRLPKSRLMLQNQGQFAWRKDGIKHAWNPETIAKLQLATRQGNYEKFKEWAKMVDQKEKPIFIRDFFGWKKAAKPTPIDEVEIRREHREALRDGCYVVRCPEHRGPRGIGAGHEQTGCTLEYW